MKKIISKFALIGVSVAALLTSCVVEDIQTTFDLADAKCQVDVTVLYALDKSDVTGQATFSHKYGSAASFTVPAVNKAIQEETISITANFKGLTDTKDVKIATLLPGGVATYKVLFVFGSDEDITYQARLASEDPKEITEYLANSHYAHATHDGTTDNWLYNDSEFILTGTVDYQEWSGSEVLNYTPADDPNVKSFVDAIKANYAVKKDNRTLDIKVSAWAAYQVWQTLTVNTCVYDVVKVNKLLGTEEKIGEYTIKAYTAAAAQFDEKANPGHEAHYHEGHGHDDHGGHSNAGGGIVLGE